MKEVNLLDTQSKSLQAVNNNLERADSIRAIQLERCMLQVEIQDQAITSLNKTIQKKDNRIKAWKNWAIGGFAVSAGLLTILLIK